MIAKIQQKMVFQVVKSELICSGQTDYGGDLEISQSNNNNILVDFNMPLL